MLSAMAASHPDLLHVRSWYGLPAELDVEDRLWHLVQVGRVRLSHPPGVNTFLPGGLPRGGGAPPAPSPMPERSCGPGCASDDPSGAGSGGSSPRSWRTRRPGSLLRSPTSSSATG